jgi:hypothetical protein
MHERQQAMVACIALREALITSLPSSSSRVPALHCNLHVDGVLAAVRQASVAAATPTNWVPNQQCTKACQLILSTQLLCYNCCDATVP